MNKQVRSAWDALDGEWHYLGRRVTGGFDIATLIPGRRQHGATREQVSRSAPEKAGEPLAPAFTSRAAAREFVATAPAGVELLSVAADDLRAKEEWLRALISQGTRTLVFDPLPGSLDAASGSGAAIATHLALGYILSHRRASACL